MLRHFYIGLGAVLVASLAAWLVYWTPAPPAVPPVPQEQAGEFGDVSLRLDYATTTAARELGLGGRPSVPDGYGMLFVFPKDAPYGFWMKDMLVPIDMFWLDAQGHVVSIAPDVATSTYPNVLYPAGPARYVLETAAGFATAHAITVGTPLLLKNFPIVSE